MLRSPDAILTAVQFYARTQLADRSLVAVNRFNDTTSAMTITQFAGHIDMPA
jgi:hypothetical protein